LVEDKRLAKLAEETLHRWKTQEKET
jgi:hypothetical protein